MSKIKQLLEKKINPNTLNSQTLAYLGDAVYEVYIRRHLLKGGVVRPQVLQRDVTYYVSAKAQAALITKMQDDQILTEAELATFKRGRSAKSHTHARNTKVATHKLSTGFEAILGYLELLDKQERIEELATWCIKQVEAGGIDSYDFS